MKRAALWVGISLGIASVAIAAPASAAPVGFSVAIVAHEDFTATESEFESTLEGCEEGTVVTGDAKGAFTKWGGTFVGIKSFTCADEVSGFSVRLNARFGADGSTGTWTLVDAWGALAGLKGSGSLAGFPTSDTSIDDIYTGTLR